MVNSIENELIVLTKETIDIFLKSDNAGDLIALYTFYYYTAKWQETNQPKCTTNYVANGLNWTERKVRKIKQELADLGLVSDVQEKDEQGKIKGHYIKLHYIIKKSTLAKSDSVENPQCGKSDSVENCKTNALNNNNINALNNNIEKKKESKQSFDNIFLKYTTNETTLDLLKEWLKVRKAKRAAMTDRAIQMNIEKLDSLAEKSQMSVNEYLGEVICRGWAAFYEIRNYNTNKKSGNNIFLDIAKEEFYK